MCIFAVLNNKPLTIYLIMSKKIFTLIDTSSVLDYNDYVQFCADNEITPGKDGSDDYWNWVADQRNIEVDDFMLNLQYARINEEPVVITGSLGTWRGRVEIYPMIVESSEYEECNGKFRYKNPAILKAVQKCINGMDDFKVEYANGELVIHGYHHDGTNIFTINKLTPKGKVTVYNAKESGKQIDPKPYMFGKIRESDLW